jgi:hypothetical protein
MTVVTLGATGPGATATAADAGKMFVMTGAEALLFDDSGDLTGRRFEFFNSTNSSLSIEFSNSVVVNGVNGAVGDITIPSFSHVVVMGISDDEYIAWVDDKPTNPI